MINCTKCPIGDECPMRRHQVTVRVTENSQVTETCFTPVDPDNCPMLLKVLEGGSDG